MPASVSTAKRTGGWKAARATPLVDRPVHRRSGEPELTSASCSRIMGSPTPFRPVTDMAAAAAALPNAAATTPERRAGYYTQHRPTDQDAQASPAEAPGVGPPSAAGCARRREEDPVGAWGVRGCCGGRETDAESRRASRLGKRSRRRVRCCLDDDGGRGRLAPDRLIEAARGLRVNRSTLAAVQSTCYGGRPASFAQQPARQGTRFPHARRPIIGAARTVFFAARRARELANDLGSPRSPKPGLKGWSVTPWRLHRDLSTTGLVARRGSQPA